MTDGAVDLGFDGAVLAGGASRRMGTDKAFIPVDGVPMVQRVATALTAAGARRVVVIGGDQARLAGLGLDSVADPDPGLGPLAALATALALLPGPTVVLPCDLTRPDATTIARLVTALIDTPEAQVALPWTPPGQPIDVLSSAWRSSALIPARRLLAAGVRAPRVLVAELVVAEVSGLDSATIVDADRPEDLPPTGGPA
ncbi:MAG: molybdenum cofactor guanylyltransferase [Actinomycetia bacterium]|nr:molybdenum cofactor guanylyltransferase [Actinomycetes bacterium]MCP3910424.1 molybdenum cofactor guanylyltransferase [Actinomycetes bacterium]MCP4085487.1 molybdenum cofactor guanylyltransferase [Actinomycetes bacterium]